MKPPSSMNPNEMIAEIVRLRARCERLEEDADLIDQIKDMARQPGQAARLIALSLIDQLVQSGTPNGIAWSYEHEGRVLEVEARWREGKSIVACYLELKARCELLERSITRLCRMMEHMDYPEIRHAGLHAALLDLALSGVYLTAEPPGVGSHLRRWLACDADGCDTVLVEDVLVDDELYLGEVFCERCEAARRVTP